MPSVAEAQDALSAAKDAIQQARSAVPLRQPQSGHDLAVTISGGVSLGVYQAGFMYMLTESAKRHQHIRFQAFTGASAGSANSLTSAVNSCREPNDFPHEDLGWKIWVDVGYQDLFVEEKVTDVSVFTRDAIIKKTDYIRQAFKQGLRSDCDVLVGITTTREKTRVLELAPGLSVPTQSEKFMVRIRGRGPGIPPVVTNYVDFFSHLPQPLLPLKPQRGAEDTVGIAVQNFDHVAGAVYASMAFPVAFKPQRIQYCFTTPWRENSNVRPRFECLKPEHDERFIDGGVYDNNPLRLATTVVSRGLRESPEGRAFWRDPRLVPGQEKTPAFESLEYPFVDPDTRAYPVIEEPNQPATTALIPMSASLVAEFVETSRSRELYALLQDDPKLEAQMRLSTVHYPTASEHLAAFMGLFERDFRVFDFYLGMYDGLVVSRAYRDGGQTVNLAHLLGKHGTALEEVTDQWRPFACMVSVFESEHENYRNTCNGDDLRNFRILLQGALDRLYSACQKLNPTDLDGYNHARCSEAALRKSPPRLTGLPKLDDDLQWLKTKDESDFDHTMRLLKHYEFVFTDLGLTRNNADKGRIKIRRKLLKMFNFIADAQEDTADRTALITAGRSLANSIAYEPPRDFLYGAVGSATEVGASLLPWDWDESWARLHVAFQMKGLFSFLTQDESELQLTPMMGPEFHLLFLTNQAFQPFLGLRGGYQFSTRDDFNFESCRDDATDDDRRKCSQAIVQPYFVVTLLERIRFQLAFEFYPQDIGFDDKRFDILAALGVHFF